MDPSDSDERYLSDSEGTTASTCSEFTCDPRNDLEDSEVWNCDSLELDVETALDVLSTYDYGLEAKKLIDQGESRESVETAEALLKGGAEPYTVTATSIESAQAMLEEEAEPPTATAESAEADQKVLKKEVESSMETAGILEIDQEIPKEKVELLTAFAKSVETAQALLEEVERFTASTKSAETAQEIMEDDIKPLTETVKCIETAKETVGEEAETLTALASTELETAVSDYVYSEYSLPPSETNAEIEFDVIAKASPLSTAVSGSVSWYSMPRSETEVERMYDVRIGFYKKGINNGKRLDYGETPRVTGVTLRVLPATKPKLKLSQEC
ncbi:hypothetical protein KIN20_020619 [Parelaphostrongylus tenuis]|uniref:Uncharacterized protein n=1 Tax=Parelaphostrongylus tenuis TaxID=148309 RepID=A0AAD5MMR0_PARTN|nr:hypothetical protein KIN20_020619 [Parelaphostrongylus tenuis]